MRALASASLLLSLTTAGAAYGEVGELQASYEFLVRARADGGVMFKMAEADGGHALPASFRDSPEYWGRYVCRMTGNDCAVTDTYNPGNYELTPQPGPAGELQTERVNVHNGANIYDAATWQIAVMLGAVKNGFAAPGGDAYALASNLNKHLQRSGAQPGAAPGANRAVTAGGTFTYNGKSITDGKSAYAFRAIAPDYLARDPLIGTRFADFITATALPTSNPSYAAGKITWSDWKPITGENAWAFLIGPLQAAYLHHVIDQKKAAVPLDDLAIRNALDVLPTFAAMQSAVGGVYYAPAGTVGNKGTERVNPHEVSVENNLSLYAGLRILHAALTAQGGEKRAPKEALRLIDVMLNGGSADGKTTTAGLTSFFRNVAWKNGAFAQGGLATDRGWIPSTGARAVDVQTWAIAALGTRQIDQWFGYGAAFELWQNLKTWGGHGQGKTLWGVGYSDQDGNGIDPAGSYRQGVMSAEWTAGAINAVRNMLATYGAEKASSAHYAAAAKYMAALKEDEAAMLKGVQMLRSEKYPAAAFPGRPDNYASLMPERTKPYLYASKRYAIPFGWYANPIPSTASTAWMIMVGNNFDPFGWGGRPN